MSQRSRKPRAAAEEKRLKAALRVNLLKRKQAKTKTAAKVAKSAPAE